MQKFDTPATISAVLEIPAGRVQFIAANRTDTTVEVLPADPSKSRDVQAAEQTTVTYTDGVLRIHAPEPKNRLTGSGSLEVTIQLPAGSHVEAKTAAYTVVAGSDNGKVFTTEGASGAVTFSLPPATVGQWYGFAVGAAQELRIDPNGSETIALPSSGAQSAAGKYITADAVGEYVEIFCAVAGDWNVVSYIGTWTAEA